MQDFLLSFGLSNFGLLTLAAIGLTISIIVEQSQLIAKYLGVVRKKVAGGYNLAMKIMVLNRLGAVLYFLLISLAIDFGSKADLIGHFFIVAIIAIAIFNLGVTVKLIVGNKFKIRDVLKSDLAYLPVFMSMVASLFGILGLTLPMLLSASNPDLRLTMANTGFLLNSIFTIITVFFVESYLAKLIDDPAQNHRTIHFVITVFAMRFLGALIAIIAMIVITKKAWLLDLNTWF